jgi:hypothetical protein
MQSNHQTKSEMTKLKDETQKCTTSCTSLGKEASSEKNDDEDKPCKSFISDGIMI